ncbi:hypothetical protein MBH78_04020 [Oceanimonas sp. NS1]|nr:hypothetical protein [Oceanimonas sp. NS1]
MATSLESDSLSQCLSLADERMYQHKQGKTIPWFAARPEWCRLPRCLAGMFTLKSQCIRE